MADVPYLAEVSKLHTCILTSIVSAQDFRDPMFQKDLLHKQDGFLRSYLACWVLPVEEHLRIEVPYNQVLMAIKHVMKRSDATTCHGLDGGGVGSSGVAEFLGRNLMQVTQLLMTSSMALV